MNILSSQENSESYYQKHYRAHYLIKAIGNSKDIPEEWAIGDNADGLVGSKSLLLTKIMIIIIIMVPIRDSL